MGEKVISIQLTISALVGVAVIISTFYLADLSHNRFEGLMVSQTQNQLLTIAKATGVSLREFVSEHVNSLVGISNNQLFYGQKGEYLQLKIFYESHKQDIDSVYFLNSNGILLFRYPIKEGKENRVGVNYSDRPDVAHVLKEQKSYISEVFHHKLGEPFFSILEPVFKEGKLTGIVRSLITFDTISKRFIQPIKVGKKGYGQLLDNKGVILAHPKSEYVYKHIMIPRKEAFPDHDWSGLENIVKKMTNGEEGVASYHSAWRTEEKPERMEIVTAYTPIHIGNRLWSISVSMDYAEIIEPIIRHEMNTAGIALLVFLIVTAGGFALFRIHKQKALFEAELIYLKEIADSAEALRESNERMETLLNSLPCGIVVIDSETHEIAEANPQAIQMIGAPKEQIAGSQCNKFFSPPGMGACTVGDLDHTVVNLEQILHAANGKSVPIHNTVMSVTLNGRKHFIENFVDISESKRAEKVKIEREKLQGVIEMAGAICHEMNQPMQAVSGYSELLLMDISEDNPMFTNIQKIKGQIDRMGKITEKLKAITRYETKDYLKGKIIDIDRASKWVE